MKATKQIDPAWFFREFQKELRIPKHRVPRPIVIVPAGPACIGKTTTMKAIQKKLPYFIRIARDDMRVFLTQRGFTDRKQIDNFLFRASPSFKLTKIYLKKGYSLILDYNFAAHPSQSMPTVELAKSLGAGFFVIRINASREFIKRKLQNKRFLKAGVMTDWRSAYAEFLRTSKQFDYDKIKRFSIAGVKTDRPLAKQLLPVVDKLRSEMML